MATLYVTEPGVQVHKQGQRLILRRSGETLEDIPLIKVDRVVLMGRGVSITTPTLHALTRLKIGVFYLNRGGGFISRMVGREHKHTRLRQAQALATVDPERSLSVARAIVDGKLNNQRVLVQRHARNSSGSSDAWVHQALNLMDGMRRQLGMAGNLDELRGREGLAAREYFRLFRQLLRQPADGASWGFERREYYPPPDPINALLSFGYSLLLNDLVAVCQMTGLDPDLGFFHAVDYAKPAMALDLEEELRPIIVDSIVLYAINRSLVRLEDFQAGRARQADPENSAEEPAHSEKPNSVRSIYLRDEARRGFIALYEARLNEQIYYPPTGERTTYRRILELQAYQMARLILGEADGYVPFMVR